MADLTSDLLSIELVGIYRDMECQVNLFVNARQEPGD